MSATEIAEPVSGRRRAGRMAVQLLLRLVPVFGLVVAVTTWSHLPRMRLEPAVLGLCCWTIGNYLFCPLRWRAVSTRGQRWRWYARVYAEGELLGMLTPQHAGADIWRIRQLVGTGADRTSAVVEVAADRLAGGAMIVVVALVAGAEFPPRLLPVLAIVALAVGAVGALTRRWWRAKVATVARPPRAAFLRGALISAAYQAGYLGFMLGLIAAVGHHVDPLGTVSVLGLSQFAGLLPGIHGAGPKEGAMTGGLVALGLPLSAALAAVALGAALTWVPAVAVGGSGLAARSLRRRRQAAVA